MAEDNNPPQNKKSRRAKAPAAKAASNTVVADTKVSNSYDAQAYGIFKIRLTDQSSQIKRMTDYSEDSSIRLNDIYEILRDIKPKSNVSSLDMFFNENGYIPVKVLNPCCEGEITPSSNNSGLGVDAGDLLDYGKMAKKLWPLLLRAAPWVAAASLSGDTNPELENKQLERLKKEEEAAALADKNQFDDAARLMKDFYENGGAKPARTFSIGGNPYNIDDPEYWRYTYLDNKGVLPLIDKINSLDQQKRADDQYQGIGDRDRQNQNPYVENEIKKLSDKIDELLSGAKPAQQKPSPVISNKTYDSTSANPSTLSSPFSVGDVTALGRGNAQPKPKDEPTSTPTLNQTIQKIYDSNSANPATLSSPFSVGDVTAYGKKDNPADIFKPEKISSNVGVTPKSDITLASYGIEKDNTNNTTLSARKINFVAKEITYEANKFEFIDQSSSSSSSSSSSYSDGVSQVSFNPQDSAVPMNGGSGAINNPSMGGVTYGDSGSSISEIQETGAGYNVVELADGTIEKRTGARNWSNNNPGNIEYGDFAIRRGAIGSDGRFAIFPNFETGEKAQESLLFEGKTYKGLTIAQAITKYAPPVNENGEFENNTQAYINSVASAIGVSPNTPLSQLSSEQRDAMLKAMHQVEGFKRGKVDIIKPGTKLASDSNELSPHADITSKSASTTMELNMPVKTGAPAVSTPSLINVSSPAHMKENEPLHAAFDDIWERLQDNTLMQYA